MKTHLETITQALEQALRGEEIPSFRSADFAELFGAMKEINADIQPHRIQEEFGRIAMSLLLDRYAGAMHAERAMSIMRDKSRPTC